MRTKFGIPASSQPLDIKQNSDRDISDFRNSSKFLVEGNCHNSRTSDDIDMKLVPVTKIDKRNKTTTNLWPIRSNPEAGLRTQCL